MGMIGKALDSGKAEVLEIPPFAHRAFSGQPLDALDMYAGARLMAYGMAGAQGKRIWPWQRKRVMSNANKIAQGRGMLYSPLGMGVMQ